MKDTNLPAPRMAPSVSAAVKLQAAEIMFGAVTDFLRESNVSSKAISHLANCIGGRAAKRPRILAGRDFRLY